MNKGKRYQIILKAYAKERMPVLAAYFFIIVVFFLISSLYGYENSAENMLYAIVIIAFAGVIAGAADYFSYHKKCMTLMEAADKAGESDYFLPAANKLPERLYQEMLTAVQNEKRKLISELDEKKKDMADYYTMWIHQIKTPISAMNLLLQQTDEKQAEEELFKIEQYAEMALSYARLDSLSSDLLLKKYETFDIVKQAVKKYAVLFIRSGLTFCLEEFSCQAVTDEKWLAFVIEQILSNALKYTSEGEIRIYGLPDRDKIGNCIVIEDTGMGIRESDLPRIYERGFTGYNGRMDKKSTGIGLYLCKEICDRLSHHLSVESELGKGTRVILDFKQEKNQ